MPHRLPAVRLPEGNRQLKTVLARYPAEELGHWTWILVRSEDWKPIVRGLKVNPESPAFVALEQRETFLEEALFGHEVLRGAELAKEWQLPLDQLLSLAVTHELGHAICDEHDEAAADRFGEELRKGHMPPCRIPERKELSQMENLREKPDRLVCNPEQWPSLRRSPVPRLSPSR